MTSAAASRSPLLSILSDQPADDDRLNFDPYAKTLTDIIADPGTDTPLTIGVFGGWGQGKTSLMRILRGGSWWNDNPAAVCRCGYRGRFDPRFWSYFRGFRCARTLSSSPCPLSFVPCSLIFVHWGESEGVGYPVSKTRVWTLDSRLACSEESPFRVYDLSWRLKRQSGNQRCALTFYLLRGMTWG